VCLGCGNPLLLFWNCHLDSLRESTSVLKTGNY
jgi:hypothetical protein